MKAVVFDMDGILFDTERVCEAGWIAVAESMGMPGMKEIFPKCIGQNANGSRKVVLEAYGEDFDYPGFRQKASDWFWNYIEKNGLPMMAGVKEILEWLRASGWKIGLASSTKRSSIEDHLERAGIRSYFSAIVSGDMVEYSKPNPEIYLLACKELGTAPGETYAIEDSPNGIRSAYGAGMMPIMVPDMLAPDEEMRMLSFRIFENLSEVLEFFRQTEEKE